MLNDYKEAYQHYCWPVNSVSDLTLAPFHILATEGAAHLDKDQEWHMTHIKMICDRNPDLFLATNHKIINLFDDEQVDEVIKWWTGLTEQGGEGMVIKPYDFIASGKKGLVQPAVKCRGKEYLRIIYGPEYTAAENMLRLKNRGLSGKRSLALREFALGVEGLERFVKREELRKVHECVFGVLGLESEEVDPRL